VQFCVTIIPAGQLLLVFVAALQVAGLPIVQPQAPPLVAALQAWPALQGPHIAPAAPQLIGDSALKG
jgi:hypothetical protein